MPTLNFYMDDSGTRKPDRAPMGFDSRRPNHFALGGILILEDEENQARAEHAALCTRWRITYPLHSVDMRAASKEFRWLRRDSPDYQPFMRELTQMLLRIPGYGLACVIDRPGYDARYRQKYGRNQWQLCRTAFNIAVERAAKHARRLGCRLRVLPERSNKKDENRIKQYYRELREQGPPFDAATSAQYAPLSAAEFAETLFELDFKHKNSPMAQIADLYLWPILRARYHPGYRPFEALRSAGRLIECVLGEADVAACGSKYSCFELVDAAARAVHERVGDNEQGISGLPGDPDIGRKGP
jgi:hypothetical protein